MNHFPFNNASFYKRFQQISEEEEEETRNKLNSEGEWIIPRIATFMGGTIGVQEVASLVVDMIKRGKLAGRAILLDGDRTGTGTSNQRASDMNLLFHTIATNLGSQAIMCPRFDEDILTEYFRRAIGLHWKGEVEVYEGVVTKKNSSIIELKTVEESKEIKLNHLMFNALQKRKVSVGDVIYIDILSSTVEKVGRGCDYSFVSEADLDLEAQEFVSLPEGNVYKKKEIVQDLTLNDLDVAMDGQSRESGAYSLVRNKMMAKGASNMNKRGKIDEAVASLINDGILELVPRVLFIDQANQLEKEHFSSMNVALKKLLSPILIFCVDKAICELKGTDTINPPNLPTELLERLIVIRAENYGHPNMLQTNETILGGRGVYDGTLQSADNAAISMLSCIQPSEIVARVVNMKLKRKMAGRAILFAGPSNSRKIVLAKWMKEELGKKIFSGKMFSLEVNSDSPKNFVNLRENHRKAITLRFKEARYVYEGEVVEVTETKSYKKKFPWFRKQKSASSWVIGLKTAEETKEYKFTPSDATFSANVVVGDVVHIQAVSGEMTRLGRCSDSFGSETVFDEQEYLPLPKGKVYKKKVIVTQEVTLHDLDVAIAHKQRHDGIYGLVQQKALLNEEINTPYDFRKRIDEAVISLIDDGELELVPGLLYITEGHKLDIECFSYLSRVLKTILCPLVILATDRGICYRANSRTHGIPVYLLKHMIIIQTCPNYKSACIIQEILKLSGKWSVASIDKRIESIKLQWNVNAAGLTACLVGATVTVLDGNSKTISFLIQLLGFLCFFISVYHYNCSLLLLNEYLPRAKVNKNEVKISIPTEIEIAHHSRAGVLSGSIGLYCVGLAIATIAWIRFSNRVADTLVLLIPLVLFMLSAPFLLFWAHRSYMRFVSKRITQRRPKEIKRV